MSGFYFSFGLTVVGMVLYHLSQKSVPAGMNPFLVIILAYAVGIALCVVCAIAYPGKKNLIESVKLSNWAVFTLGAAAALIELGFLLAYRAGWKISMAAVGDQRCCGHRPHSDRHTGFQRSFVLAKCRRTCILHFRISNGHARLAQTGAQPSRLTGHASEDACAPVRDLHLETKTKSGA
jgi:hypothetical protein